MRVYPLLGRAQRSEVHLRWSKAVRVSTPPTRYISRVPADPGVERVHIDHRAEVRHVHACLELVLRLVLLLILRAVVLLALIIPFVGM